MAVKYPNFQAQELGSSPLAIYTAPTGSDTSYSQIRAFTVYGADRDTLSVHLVKSGGSVVTGNLKFNRTIAKGEDRPITSLINHTMTAGDYISVYSLDGGKLNIELTIKEVS